MLVFVSGYIWVMKMLINEPVEVISVSGETKQGICPLKLRWRGRWYRITQWGYYHRVFEGRNVFHIFSVANDDLAFRLILDGLNLKWALEAVTDKYG